MRLHIEHFSFGLLHFFALRSLPMQNTYNYSFRLILLPRKDWRDGAASFLSGQFHVRFPIVIFSYPQLGDLRGIRLIVYRFKKEAKESL